MSAVTQSSVQAGQVAPISKLWWVGLVAALSATVANVIFFVVTKGLGIPYILPLQGPEAPLELLPVMMVVIASMVPTIGATFLLVVLGKFLAKPLRVFWIISVVFLLGSLVLPLTLPVTVAVSTKIGLSAMHVIAGAAIVGVLSKLGRHPKIS